MTSRSSPVWISKAAVLAIHERTIAEHGGAGGVVDGGLLESALASPINHHAHGEHNVFRLAALYAHAITRNHPFVDGNKRVALTAAGVFLELNGARLEASEGDASAATQALSSKQMREDQFAEWLRLNSTRSARTPRAPARRRSAKKK